MTIAIPIPKESYNHELNQHHVSWNDNPSWHHGKWSHYQIEYVGNNYSILGKLSELTDEQCKPLVEGCPYYAKCWKKYDADHKYGCPEGDFNADYSCWTPKESFISYLKSENKICKWMVEEPDEMDFIQRGQTIKAEFSFYDAMESYNSLPDDFLILAKQ